MSKVSRKTKTEKLHFSRVLRVRRRLINAAVKDPNVLMVQFDNTEKGFDEEQVDEMRDEYGMNEITKQKKEGVLSKLYHAFINPFTLVLIFIGLLSFTPFVADPAAGIIVFALVFFSGILKFVQEIRNSNAAEKLTDMVATTVHVQRQLVNDEEEEKEEQLESRKIEIHLHDLVVGDIVYLAAGDMIPADVRILKAKDLFVSQASLTGESEPVEKFATPGAKKQENPLEYNNLAFMGTNVVSGSAMALVLAVGDDTIFGGIARQLQIKKAPTSFEKGITSVSWTLIRFMLVMVPVVFVLSGLRHNDWLGSFTFAIAVAVGLTPEMLPMIVSANLAKGAVFMSRKKVIVKDLGSIQNFGAMDVLCTDKTGTITQDKVILQYHLDVHGDEDPRVLRHAYLNSYYQTGLKNLMDFSIIEKAVEADIVDQFKNHIKVDEIPFDFQRRRMSVVVQSPEGKTQMITKGAIEEMLAVCTRAEYRGKIEPITDKLRAEILEVCRTYNDDGMRVLAVAQKNDPKPEDKFGIADEKDMVLIGYLAFLDPPKETARAAIAALNEHGVNVKVLTGDNDAVTRCVCRQVGLAVGNILLGGDIEKMDDTKLRTAVEQTNVFAKLSPSQKVRVVAALRANGHTVGFMGDGINDAAAMKSADIGISVDTAVDIAKESANIILLEKDLMVLEQGIIEGRKIYGNIVKYIKMTASSNFGNMFSVLAAASFLPFLPMLPLHILVLNLIYDMTCAAVPWDNVDKEFLLKPRKWEAKSMTRFMLWFGPTSSVFDIATYLGLFWLICPNTVGQSWSQLDAALAPMRELAVQQGIPLSDVAGAADILRQQQQFASIFQTGWFVESLMSQTLVIHLLRSPHFPLVKTRSSWQVTLLTMVGITVGTVMPFIPLIAVPLNFTALPLIYFAFLAAVMAAYFFLVTLFKWLFLKRYSELL